MAAQSSVQTCPARIVQIQLQLQALGPMRPGSVSVQYTVCGKPRFRGQDPKNPRRHGPYYQLNYVYDGKKAAYYVQKEDLKQVPVELANYKKFRQLIHQWIGLTVHIANLKQKRPR